MNLEAEMAIIARRKRDAGLEQVSANNPDWLACAYQQVLQARKDAHFYPNGFTADHVRKWITGIGKPKSDNCYGALMNKLIKSGNIEYTDRLSNSTRAASNHRALKVYRWS